LRLRQNTITCSGVMDKHAAGQLAERCSRLADRGARKVILDVSGVARCEPAGLVGLWELREGWCGLPVRVIGGHWAQFVSALLHAGADDFEDHYRMIQALLNDPRPAVPARRAPHHGA
jgi:hypothetical protein